ncbi:hypothetical protein LSCM1_07857 [Leishmania martiniquensis]|uniref:Uncharacterized protein n=1 Tax=Leishmania martiniquensis TaxID=1580590 RepID=A0A836HE42_9TRYP|nr:hypothetical protein LSCM1_07857 [Leishmania martiniquensis]
MDEGSRTNTSSITTPGAPSTMQPISYSSADTRRAEGLLDSSNIATASESEANLRHSMPQNNGTLIPLAEPQHTAENNASSTQLGAKDTPLGLMPRCLSCALFTSAGLQEIDDTYGRSMQSTSAAGALTAAQGCAAAAATLQTSFTPGASTSMTPAPTEVQSASDSRPLPQHRWGGNNDSGSQCASYRGADRSNNVSGCGLRLVGDDVEWLQSTFECSASSPREEVQLSWRHLQHQQYTGTSRAAGAMAPTPSNDEVSAVLENMGGAHYHFERAVQPPSPSQSGGCMSADEEDCQAAAMLWAAQKMAAFD